MFTKTMKTLARRWFAKEMTELESQLEDAIVRATVARLDHVGAMLELETRLSVAQTTIDALHKNAEEGRIARQQRLNQFNEALALAVDRLELIASKQTAGGNGTVRLMARLAREAIVEVREAAQC